MIKSKVEPIFDLANTKRKVLLLMSDENLLDKNIFFAPFSIKKTSKTHKYLGNYPEYNYEYYLWTGVRDDFLKTVSLALH